MSSTDRYEISAIVVTYVKHRRFVFQVIEVFMCHPKSVNPISKQRHSVWCNIHLGVSVCKSFIRLSSSISIIAEIFVQYINIYI